MSRQAIRAWRGPYPLRGGSIRLPRSAVIQVLKAYDACNSSDSTPMHWKWGRLDVNETWKRQAMDFAYFKGLHYLTFTDCGPSRFTVWRQVRTQDNGSVVSLGFVCLSSYFFNVVLPLKSSQITTLPVTAKFLLISFVTTESLKEFIGRSRESPPSLAGQSLKLRTDIMLLLEMALALTRKLSCKPH